MFNVIPSKKSSFTATKPYDDHDGRETTKEEANNSQTSTPIMVSEKLLLFFSSGINSLLLYT